MFRNMLYIVYAHKLNDEVFFSIFPNDLWKGRLYVCLAKIFSVSSFLYSFIISNVNCA